MPKPLSLVSSAVWLAVALGLGGLLGTDRPAASQPPTATGLDIDPPAMPGTTAPDLITAGTRVVLSWLEPKAGRGAGHRLRLSYLEGGSWSEPVVIAEGDTFFANWADFPRLGEAGDGSLVAHWLERDGPATYDYSIQLARSTDGGRTWKKLGRLHDDEVAAEHGFVSYGGFSGGQDGRVQAFWLDGREMPDGGPMTLRSRVVSHELAGEKVLDSKVCECCQTDATWTHRGPVVVYRDRSEEEVRDISIVRLTHRGWTAPATVHRDGWQIHGCPVNGPAIAAGVALPSNPRADEELAVAWFTAAEGRPRVQLALSRDSGTTFGAPLLVDGGAPLGRVDVVLDEAGGAIVSWLARAGSGAEVRLRRADRKGGLGQPRVLAPTSAARRSGFPRLGRIGDRLYVAWVDWQEEKGSRLRVRQIDASLPW